MRPDKTGSPPLPAQLVIPDRDYLGDTSISAHYYGASSEASYHCGLGRVPREIYGGWEHGWIPSHRMISPDYVAEELLADPRKEPTWVARKEHEDYLVAHGYQSKAIGLPIAYLPPGHYERIPGSLLVMPSHSLEYTKHRWRFEEYVEEIGRIRDRFHTVVICIHPSCIRNGYWVEEFARQGFPIIEGADARDLNSLERVRALMSQFEFVTTNSCSSLVAYAAAFGAKISIFGPYAEFELSDFEKAAFYLRRPGMAEKMIEISRETSIRQHMAEFFTDPDQAPERTIWGNEQIGMDNVVSPGELKRLFRWRWRDLEATKIRKRAKAIAPQVYKLAKRATKQVLKPEVWRLEQERERLEQWKAGQEGVTRVQGREFFFDDGNRFFEEYDRCFWKWSYDFPCILGSPLIIDGSPGYGLALRFWAEKFPAPRLIAIADEACNLEILQKNTAETGCRVYRRTDGAEGLIPANEKPGTSPEQINFYNLISEPVDFLKLKLHGDRLDSVIAGMGKHAENVRYLHIKCRLDDNFSRMKTILGFLSDHHFAFTINTQIQGKPLPARFYTGELTSQEIDLWARNTHNT